MMTAWCSLHFVPSQQMAKLETELNLEANLFQVQVARGPLCSDLASKAKESYKG